MQNQSSTRERLIKRLDSYYKLEGINATWIACLIPGLIYFMGLRDTIFINYGIFVMVVILIQGTHYWRLKMHSLQGKRIDHPQQIRLFQKCKRLNQILICLIPLACLAQWRVSGNAMFTSQLIGWAAFTNLFAIAEHVNYFHYQLMYDNEYDWKFLVRNRRLKIASLKKDMDTGRI